MPNVDLTELERYLRIYQENPDSRVFAPLADLYRRLGRLSEAEDICREGNERHPYYAGGKVALAHVLLDSGRLDEALREAESVVVYYPDNLLARKILIRVLGHQGERERAEREWMALQAVAPEVAQDPELEKALAGPRSGQPPRMPGLADKIPISKGFLNQQPSQEDGHRAALLRRKAILETWLRLLGTPSRLG